MGEASEVKPLLRDPTGVIRTRFAGYEPGWSRAFEWGRRVMALEIESVARILEGVAGTSLLALEREEIISVLRTFLRNQGLADWVDDNYDEMCAQQRTRFVAVSDDDADDSAESVSQP